MAPPPPDDPSSAPKKRPTRKPSTRRTFDFSAAYRHVEFQSRELPQELKSRLVNEEKAAEHERWKEKMILAFVLLLLASVAAYCLLTIALATAQDDRNWAKGVLGMIVSLGVGYFGGKSGRAT